MAPLDDLMASQKVAFPHLQAARARTQRRLASRSVIMGSVALPPDCTVVLMGSWGRAEITSSSDDDFMVLVHGQQRAGDSLVSTVAAALQRDPEGFKDPGGARASSARLRTSRKLLFASGLIPILRCHELQSAGVQVFLANQLLMTPIDRLADACIYHGLESSALRIVSAYDKFLELLDDADFRRQLEAVTAEAARNSREFGVVQELGREIDEGLLEILYSPALDRWTREYGIL